MGGETGSGEVMFPGKVKIGVGPPGQGCPFVTLEVVCTHVRMQLAPVVVDGRTVAAVVTTFVRAIETKVGESSVRSNGWGYIRKADHMGGLGGLELIADVVVGRGGEWEGCITWVGPCMRCANVPLPEFDEVMTRGHANGTDSPGSGETLVRHVDLSKIHENTLADEVLSIVAGGEWTVVRCDAGNGVGIVEIRDIKGRGESFLGFPPTGVAMGRWVVVYASGGGRGIIEGMIGQLAELRGRSGSRITVGEV